MKLIVPVPVPDVGEKLVNQFGTGVSMLHGQPGPVVTVMDELAESRRIRCELRE